MPTGDDAGPWLNPRLAFDGLATPGPIVSETCSALVERFKQREHEMPSTELAACDTTLLAELQRFGRWSFTSGPREALPHGTRTAFAMPDFSQLMTLAKLHLVKGHADGRVNDAADDVRHLVKLLFTSEYLLSVMVGTALLSLERRLTTAMGAGRGVTRAQLGALRGRVFAAVYARYTVLDDVVATTHEPRFIRCVALTEAAFMGKMTLDEPTCWFENARFDATRPYLRGARGPLDVAGALDVAAALGDAVLGVLAPDMCQRLREQLLGAAMLPDKASWRTLELPHDTM